MCRLHDEGFFSLSKLAWVVLAPSNALVLGVTLGGLLGLSRQARRFGGKVFVVSACGFAAATLLPFGEWATASLERRYPPLSACETDERPHVTGIIVLGGALSTIARDSQHLTRLGEASDRVTLAADLAEALNHPEFAGGSKP